MYFSWVSTALALAATVSAGVLRDVSPVKQLSVRDTTVSSVSQTTVLTYFKSTTQLVQGCDGRVKSVSTAQKAVTIVTQTITKIQSTPSLEKCTCAPFTTDANYIQSITDVFVSIQTLIITVAQTFTVDIKLFTDCFVTIKKYLGVIVSFSSGIGLDLSVYLGNKIDISVFAAIGISFKLDLHLDILGIDIGIDIGGLLGGLLGGN